MFGLWPLVMQKSELPDTTKAFLLTSVTIVVVGFAFFAFMSTNSFQTAGQGIIIAVLIASVGGAMNGFGTLKFLDATSAVAKIDLAKAILTMILMQVTANELGGDTSLRISHNFEKGCGIYFRSHNFLFTCFIKKPSAIRSGRYFLFVKNTALKKPADLPPVCKNLVSARAVQIPYYCFVIIHWNSDDHRTSRNP